MKGKRVRCSNWSKCSKPCSRHGYNHFWKADCLEECDEPGYTECKKVHIRQANNSHTVSDTAK